MTADQISPSGREEHLEGPRGTRPEEYEKTLALAQSIFRRADLARDYALEWNSGNCENQELRRHSLHQVFPRGLGWCWEPKACPYWVEERLDGDLLDLAGWRKPGEARGMLADLDQQ